MSDGYLGTKESESQQILKSRRITGDSDLGLIFPHSGRVRIADGFRTRKCLVTVIAATLIALGAVGCHASVSVHSNPGGVSVTHTLKAPARP